MDGLPDYNILYIFIKDFYILNNILSGLLIKC